MRTWRVAIYAGLVVGTTFAAWFLVGYAAERGQVHVGTACDSSGQSARTHLRFGEPMCAALVLDDPLGDAAVVEMTLEQTDGDAPRTAATHSWPLSANDDQVLFRSPDVERLAGGRPGAYRVAFRVGPDLVGEQSLIIER